MSVTIEISNTTNLRRARTILGARSDAETAELAIEKIIEGSEPKLRKPEITELPDEFWDGLFSQPQLPRGTSIKAVLDDRDEARF